MSQLGVHFALSADDDKKLLSFRSEDDLMEYLEEELEETYFKLWKEQWVAESDKAWDAIHRALTDGEFDFDNGQYPLSHCIAGGRQLYSGDDYIVAYKSSKEVADIAGALRDFTNEQLADGYWLINRETYQAEVDAEDLDYTTVWFGIIKGLYSRAAEAGRSVIFTVSQ